jgi:hypothetical protein
MHRSSKNLLLVLRVCKFGPSARRATAPQKGISGIYCRPMLSTAADFLRFCVKFGGAASSH